MRRLVAKIITGLGLIAGVMSMETTQSESESDTALAMIVLRSPKMPDPNKLSAFVAAQWPDAVLPSEIAVDSNVMMTADSNVMMIGGEKGTYMTVMMLLDVPIPADELRYACESSAFDQKVCDEFVSGPAHLIVSVSGEKSTALDRHILLSRLLIAAADQIDAIGVYWGSAESAWPMGAFVKLAGDLDPSNPPALLWTGLKFQREPDGMLSAITIGMPAFGLMNVEVHKSKRSAGELFEFIPDIASYLISRGPVLKDGDTIGGSAAERIKVHFGPSLRADELTAYIVDY